jgi:hypothetical protein
LFYVEFSRHGSHVPIHHVPSHCWLYVGWLIVATHSRRPLPIVSNQINRSMRSSITKCIPTNNHCQWHSGPSSTTKRSEDATGPLSMVNGDGTNKRMHHCRRRTIVERKRERTEDHCRQQKGIASPITFHKSV